MTSGTRQLLSTKRTFLSSHSHSFQLETPPHKVM